MSTYAPPVLNLGSKQQRSPDAADSAMQGKRARGTTGPLIKLVIPPSVGTGIIGRKGEFVREIAQGSGGAHLNLAQPGPCGSRVLVIKAHQGQHQVVSAAACLVVGRLWQLLNSPPSMRQAVLVPVVIVPLLVGKSGANIKRLEEETGAHFSLAREHQGIEQELTLTGPWEAIQRAVAMVVDLFASAESRGDAFLQYNSSVDPPRTDAVPSASVVGQTGQADDPSQLRVRVQLPQGLPLGPFIGKEGTFMKDLSKTCAVRKIHIEDGWMEMVGELTAVYNALYHASDRWRRLQSGYRAERPADGM